MYYAGLRPEEAVSVTLPDCTLPETGWGRLALHRTRPQAGKKRTDSVEVLLTRYAECLYDRQSINNQRIKNLLTAYDLPNEPDYAHE